MAIGLQCPDQAVNRQQYGASLHDTPKVDRGSDAEKDSGNPARELEPTGLP